MIFQNGIPNPPVIEAVSNKKFDAGGSVNGIHISNFQHVELFLDIYRGDGWVCRSCHQPIRYGQVVGRSAWESGSFCLNCLTIKGNIQAADLLTVELTVKLKRRSRKHPDAKCRLLFVGTFEMLTHYTDAAGKAGYPIIQTKQIEV